MNDLTSKLASALLLIALLVASLPSQAEADPPDDPASTPAVTAPVDLSAKSPAWLKVLNKQMLLSLDSPVASVREQTMQNIITFAAAHGDQVDLSGMADKLYEIYRWDESEAHRIMALAALYAVNDLNSMERLAQDVEGERSERVRRHAERILAAYYLEHVRKQ